MNITRENIDDVNAVLKLTIVKSDYDNDVNQKLKEYRQKASIPGFRPGKVPMGLIKKKVGTAILVEEINNKISQSLSKYLVEEKLNILGEPLPNEDQQQEIDWTNDQDFEFVFDIALAPEVNVTLDKRSKYTYYNIAVSEEMIDKQVEMAASQLGQNIQVDEAKEESLVRGNFVQLDNEGNEVEEGIRPEGVLLAVNKITDVEIKNSFVGSKKEDILIFDPVKAFGNRHEVGHMLNISHEAADELNSEFRFTVTEITQFEKAAINEELFKKLYGDDTEIKTVEDFRNRIKEEIAANLKYSSEHKFALDTRDTLVEKLKLKLPESFLKRWLVAVNKELTADEIEKDFGHFLKDLEWQLIKDSIIKENELTVSPEETEFFAKQIARSQFAQYGMYDVPDEQLNNYAKMILEKQEETERIYKKLYEDKVIQVVKEKVNIQEKEVSQDEFNKMLEATK